MLETIFHEPIFNETSKLSKMKQKFQIGKITTDEYNTEINNRKDRLAEIVKKMNIMRDSIKAQDKNIENQSINSSISIKNIENDIEEMEQDNKIHLNETLIIKSKIDTNEYDIRGIQREVEKHSLKPNSSNRKLGGAWKSYSDDEKYPILKQDKMNHWLKYNDNLKNVKLEGDTLMDLQKFWNTLNTAFVSTLNTNKRLGDYDKLQSTFSASDELVLPLRHTQRNQVMYLYENYTRVLRDHLLKRLLSTKRRVRRHLELYQRIN